MRGYPQLSFWIPIALAKICFSRIVINRAKILLYWQAPSLSLNWVDYNTGSLIQQEQLGAPGSCVLPFRDCVTKMYRENVPRVRDRIPSNSEEDKRPGSSASHATTHSAGTWLPREL